MNRLTLAGLAAVFAVLALGVFDRPVDARVDRPVAVRSRTLDGLSGIAGVQAPSLLSSPPAAATFHHLHLIAGSREMPLVAFYERLFPPSAITRGKFWDADGIRGDGAFLLWSQSPTPREFGKPTAIWHFGWGKVSVGETYAAHLIKEVNWKPPYPSLTSDLHVHLRSRDPRAAASWYESVLGAKREVAARDPAASPATESPSTAQTSVPPVRSSTAASPATSAEPHIEGEAEALVRLGAIALVIHWTEQTLEPTRRVGPIDHLSFQVPDLDALTKDVRARNIAVLDRTYEIGDTPSLTIEGPDRLALELIQRPKGPDFWHARP